MPKYRIDFLQKLPCQTPGAIEAIHDPVDDSAYNHLNDYELKGYFLTDAIDGAHAVKAFRNIIIFPNPAGIIVTVRMIETSPVIAERDLSDSTYTAPCRITEAFKYLPPKTKPFVCD